MKLNVHTKHALFLDRNSTNHPLASSRRPLRSTDVSWVLDGELLDVFYLLTSPTRMAPEILLVSDFAVSCITDIQPSLLLRLMKEHKGKTFPRTTKVDTKSC